MVGARHEKGVCVLWAVTHTHKENKEKTFQASRTPSTLQFPSLYVLPGRLFLSLWPDAVWRIRDSQHEHTVNKYTCMCIVLMEAAFESDIKGALKVP